MTYDIKDLTKLEKDAGELSTIIKNVTKNTDGLNNMLSKLSPNWQNEEGADLHIVMDKLEKCINTLQGTLIPVANRYVSTMNTLALASKNTQSKTM